MKKRPTKGSQKISGIKKVNAKKFRSRLHQVVIESSVIFLCVFALALSVSGQSAADGFNPNADGIVYALVVQPDGKIIVGGSFSNIGTPQVARSRIARLNPDGTVDTTFINTNSNGTVLALALQSDGKILVGGDFTSISSGSRSRIARLNSDGTLDISFDPNANTTVSTILVQPNGKILVGGDFTSIGGGICSRVARLESTGFLDVTFTNPEVDDYVYALAMQPDGKIVIGGDFTFIGNPQLNRNHIARLNLNGSPDTSFNPNANGTVYALKIQADGNILAGGDFLSIGGGSRSHIARLISNGNLDASFNNPSVDAVVYDLTLQTDGKILAAGNFTSVGSQTRNYVARLNSNGSVDTSFIDPNASNTTRALALQSDGKILVGGAFTNIGSPTQQPRNRIARLNQDGSLDATLSLSSNNAVIAMAEQNDGKIIVGGFFSTFGGNPRANIARINPDGSLDASFNPAPNGSVYSIAIQPDGKILVGGQFTKIGNPIQLTRNRIARLNTDGSVDTSFDPDANSDVYAIALQPDGKILVAGAFNTIGGVSNKYIARLDSNGFLDPAFSNPNPNGVIFAIAFQPDGKIVIGGQFSQIGSPVQQSRLNIARLNTSGSLDSGFDPKADNFVYALAIQPDGKILVGGTFTNIGNPTQQPRNYIARLNSNGSVESGFAPSASNFVNTLALQSDGKILVGGFFNQIDSVSRNYIARLLPSGSVDLGFNPNANDAVYTLLPTQSGKILTGGIFTQIGGQPRDRIARLTNDTAAMQAMSVTQNTITLTLNGASPNLSYLNFEKSTDGVNYTALGTATVSSVTPQGTVWTLAGQNLPAAQNLYIRARGSYAGGIYGGSQSLFEKVQTAYLLSPSAGGVTISGRVYATGGGRGLLGATVVLTDMNGNERTTLSSTFGYFRFDD
ncbi:MAG TPA: delta-60 repeat domain-containing protein, partial [Pyrinomonadaceae bacterium]|nr:delta-60 repeat domain-containing protein [Pyrinomonadaceae bacterium]